MHYKKITRCIPRWLKSILGFDDGKALMIGGYPLVVRNFWVSRHNLDHIEVAQLSRIRIGNAWVSGIHGFYSSMYHEQPIVPEYDGILDEVRVFIHEALTRPSICSLLKLGYWMVWLAKHRMNPIGIVLSHGQSIRHFRRRVYPRYDKLPVTSVEKIMCLDDSNHVRSIIVAEEINGYSEAQVQMLWHHVSSIDPSHYELCNASIEDQK